MVTQSDISSLLTQLHSTPDGLTALEAQERLKQYGFNEPVTMRRASLLARFLSFFGSPLALILLVAAIVTGILGDPVSATIIAAIVVASATLDFVQTLRSQNAADKLRNQVVPTATCLRDGQEREVPRREIVPGDVIRLIAGDLVPADACLIQSRDLHVNQAALTGESLPVEKEAKGTDPSLNMVYQGTSVVSGRATALVTATVRYLYSAHRGHRKHNDRPLRVEAGKLFQYG